MTDGEVRREEEEGGGGREGEEGEGGERKESYQHGEVVRPARPHVRTDNQRRRTGLCSRVAGSQESERVAVRRTGAEMKVSVTGEQRRRRREGR